MALQRKPQEIVESSKNPLLSKHESWERVSVGEIADILNGFAFKSDKFTHDKGTPLIRIRDVGKDSTKTFFDGDFDDAYIVGDGDLLVGMDGDFRCSIWKGGKALLNQRVCKISLKTDSYDFGFLSYALQPYLDAIHAETSAVTVKHLSSRSISEIPLPLPPFEQQKRIVAKIEELFSHIDAGNKALKKAKQLLKQYRQSVLKAAVTGDLTKEWREANKDVIGTVKEVLENIEKPARPNRWKTRSKEIKVGHPALAVGNPATPLPKGWEWVALVDIAKMESGHTPSRRHPEWWDGDIAWIGIVDARKNHCGTIKETIQHTNEEGLANSASRLLPKGTVCVSRTASVGYVVTLGKDMATSQDFVNWVPTPAVTSDWLQLIFIADTDGLRRFGKGTVHKTIYFPEWLSVHLGLPSVAEQNEIIERVNEKIIAIERLKSEIDVHIIKSEKNKQSILASAFSGTLKQEVNNV